MLSMVGLLIGLGLLMDDAIVIAENIYQHHERGKNRIRAAIDGAAEVLPAVFSAILTTIIAFSTFFFIEGTLGAFFREMAFVVVAALVLGAYGLGVFEEVELITIDARSRFKMRILKHRRRPHGERILYDV